MIIALQLTYGFVCCIWYQTVYCVSLYWTLHFESYTWLCSISNLGVTFGSGVPQKPSMYCGWCNGLSNFAVTKLKLIVPGNWICCSGNMITQAMDSWVAFFYVSQGPAALSVAQGEPVYDFCWYPRMNSMEPATCWLAYLLHLHDVMHNGGRCSLALWQAVRTTQYSFGMPTLERGGQPMCPTVIWWGEASCDCKDVLPKYFCVCSLSMLIKFYAWLLIMWRINASDLCTLVVTQFPPSFFIIWNL